MSYRGQSNTVIFGYGGWNALENQERIAPTDLQEAKNICFDNDMTRKLGGLASLNINSTVANATCLAGLDYWSSKTAANIISVWNDGNAYREQGAVINAQSASWGTITNPVCLLKCGNEQVGNNAKVLLFSGGLQTKFVTGAPTTFAIANIANPSVDWSSTNWPAAGILHDNRVVAWGNDNAPHAIYFSTLDDHTDFATGLPPTYDIMPGIGQYVTACTSMQTTRLFIFKYPVGIFMIDTQDLPSYYLPTTTVRDDIGCPSAFGISKVGSLGTFFIGCDGHIYSLESIMNPDADIQDSDITATLGLTDWVRDNISTDPSDLKYARLIYHAARKEVWAIFRKRSSTSNDVAILFNVKNPQAVRASLVDLGAHFNAAWLNYNSTSKSTELYCAGTSGHIYRTGQATRSIVGTTTTGYEGLAHTPDTDFGMPEINKRFDWVEVFMKSLGTSNVTLQTYVDGEYYASYQMDQGTVGSILGGTDRLAPCPGYTEFTLAAEGYVRHKIKVGGLGKTFSIKFMNDAAGADFGIAKVIVSFKPLGTTGEK